ncbi:MAG: M48 family metalloprotease [Candidatus Heimdallarchaeota archaeon]|nr:M48 family metalloprotease [Candidatus Heimdallarchaeota archaeon]
MLSKTTLWKSWLKLSTSSFFFLAINLFHIALVSTSELFVSNTGLFRFNVVFFSTFNFSTFFIALGLVIIQLVICYLLIRRAFNKKGIYRLTEKGIIPETDLESKMRFDPQLIYRWVNELAEQQGVKSITKIFLMDTNIPNALTLDVVPIPLIRRSWLVLDANILDILEEKEIKAVISHELGHIKHYDSSLNLFRYGLNYFTFIAYSLGILEMLYYIIAEPPNLLNILLRSGFLVVFILLLFILTFISRSLMTVTRRESELLADYYGAKKIGRNHMINALILLGQRLEVVHAFATEFNWLGGRENRKNLHREFLQGLKALPREELNEDFTRERAVQIYLSNRLKNLREDLYIPFTDDQIKSLANKATKELLKLRKEQIENGLVNDRKKDSIVNLHTIDWRLVDKDKDLYLNDEEIDYLIKELRNNPNKELFEDELSKMSFFLRDYPSLKERILFIYNTIHFTPVLH